MAEALNPLCEEGNLILNSEGNGTETADKLSTCKKSALKQCWA